MLLHFHSINLTTDISLDHQKIIFFLQVFHKFQPNYLYFNSFKYKLAANLLQKASEAINLPLFALVLLPSYIFHIFKEMGH